MAKIIQKYGSEDGTKEFNTAAEADAYDAGVKNAAVIEAYITKAGLLKAQAGLMRKHLASFISFEASYEAPKAAAETE